MFYVRSSNIFMYGVLISLCMELQCLYVGSTNVFMLEGPMSLCRE